VPTQTKKSRKSTLVHYSTAANTWSVDKYFKIFLKKGLTFFPLGDIMYLESKRKGDD